MVTTSNQAAHLIRQMRVEAGLTQRELAERVDSTQSVISRLESDDYEGHSLSMLYRIAAALGRRIEVRAVDEAARWARGDERHAALKRLRGALEIGPGSTVDDVRRARARRGREFVARGAGAEGPS